MDFYCKVYVESVEEPSRLAERLTAQLQGELSRSTVVAEDVEIDALRNDLDRNDPPKSFLDYPLYLDVFPSDEAGEDEERFVAAVERLLGALARLGLEYVAACDFEDQLPGSGRSPGARW
jgi:hypothetical protein